MVRPHPSCPHLRAWRKIHGRTLQWLATELGVTASTAKRHELPGAGFDDVTFEEITGIFGVTVAELSAHPSQRDKALELERLLAAASCLEPATIAELASSASLAT